MVSKVSVHGQWAPEQKHHGGRVLEQCFLPCNSWEAQHRKEQPERKRPSIPYGPQVVIFMTRPDTANSVLYSARCLHSVKLKIPIHDHSALLSHNILGDIGKKGFTVQTIKSNDFDLR